MKNCEYEKLWRNGVLGQSLDFKEGNTKPFYDVIEMFKLFDVLRSDYFNFDVCDYVIIDQSLFNSVIYNYIKSTIQALPITSKWTDNGVGAL